MAVAPLCLIQARVHSQRLPMKMLRCVGGKPLLRWCWDAAVQRFGRPHTLVVIVEADHEWFRGVVPCDGLWPVAVAEADVLGRLYDAAWKNRPTQDQARIHRVTPDDFVPALNRDVCTVQQLREWQHRVTDPVLREHIGYLFHWAERPAEINTEYDYQQALRWYEAQSRR
jgi:spore coat polysaccharide biosynthesis protein SpsF (cytidylyltransferase family)